MERRSNIRIELTRKLQINGAGCKRIVMADHDGVNADEEMTPYHGCKMCLGFSKLEEHIMIRLLAGGESSWVTSSPEECWEKTESPRLRCLMEIKS